MPERLSRIIAAIEALVLGVPATCAVLYLIGFLGMITSALREPLRDLLMLFNLLLLTFALCAGWRLLYDADAGEGLSSAFAFFGAKLVVLLPLAHLLLERLMRTNNASEPPAPGDS